MSKRLGGEPEFDRPDLAIAAGEVTASLGLNDAGKATSVGLLTGRLSQDAGIARLILAAGLMLVFGLVLTPAGGGWWVFRSAPAPGWRWPSSR